MKKAAVRKASASQTPVGPRSTARPRIHPVISYPFRAPHGFDDLTRLYELVARLGADPKTYARPITVVDRKTHYANAGNKAYENFRKGTLMKHSDVLDSWSVDTCQMWYAGLGMAMERGGVNDVYWLIPGDFNYGSAAGQEVLGRLHDLPEICAELQIDLCIGEIHTDHNHSKQLIDDYGTFALLYNWFPTEAVEIRSYTERPRSEFFAIRHGFLRELMCRRWFGYEQTVVMLLQAVAGKKSISRFNVGGITDLPEGGDSIASALQQVERTERVLKTLWRERNSTRSGWANEYHLLEAKSEQIRNSAFTILQNLLR